MQSYASMPPSPSTSLEDGVSYCDSYDSTADGHPIIVQWQAGTFNQPVAQQYERSSDLGNNYEFRVEEDATVTARSEAVPPPGVDFSQSGPAIRNALCSFSWSPQFVNPRFHDDQIIHVDQKTWYKATRNPNTKVIVYQCKWDTQGSPCRRWIEGGVREIRTHLRIYHGVQGQAKDPIRCKWFGCSDERDFKYSSIPRHIVTHLKVTLLCSNCRTQFPRDDRIQFHRRIARKCARANTVTVVGPEARLIRLDS